MLCYIIETENIGNENIYQMYGQVKHALAQTSAIKFNIEFANQQTSKQVIVLLDSIVRIVKNKIRLN